MAQDQRPETYKHIMQVQQFLHRCIGELLRRCEDHDKTKLEEPEQSLFDEYTPLLAQLTYGSPAYRDALVKLGPALEHHYAHNRHHPEAHESGIRGMTLIDLLEMLVDWKAATLRHNDGDIDRSIQLNQERFGYSDELKDIFLNTMAWLEETSD